MLLGIYLLGRGASAIRHHVHVCYSGALTASSQGFYGPGSGPVLLSKVDCSKGASSLRECKHNGWGDAGWCVAHSNDAGVQCTSTFNMKTKT